MEGSLITVALTIGTAAAMIGVMLLASWLAPKVVGRGWSKVRTDVTPYECGSRPFDAVDKHRFSVKFFLVAMLFILFDIEVVFLYPVGVILNAADSVFVLVEVVIFVVLLIVAFVYAWRRGALDWK